MGTGGVMSTEGQLWEKKWPTGKQKRVLGGGGRETPHENARKVGNHTESHNYFDANATER